MPQRSGTASVQNPYPDAHATSVVLPIACTSSNDVIDLAQCGGDLTVNYRCRPGKNGQAVLPVHVMPRLASAQFQAFWHNV